MLLEVIAYTAILMGIAALCSASFAVGAGIARYFFPPRRDNGY